MVLPQTLKYSSSTLWLQIPSYLLPKYLQESHSPNTQSLEAINRQGQTQCNRHSTIAEFSQERLFWMDDSTLTIRLVWGFFTPSPLTLLFITFSKILSRISIRVFITRLHLPNVGVDRVNERDYFDICVSFPPPPPTS